MNGAVGNFNAHVASYPDVDWQNLSDGFVSSLGLRPNPFTTQIEPHDYIAEWFHALMRFNQVLLDFDRDVWATSPSTTSDSAKWQARPARQPCLIRSTPSTSKTPRATSASRTRCWTTWQANYRSPVGSGTSPTLPCCAISAARLVTASVAYQATLKGMSRLDVNPDAIRDDLNSSWEVLGEAVQTVMRRHGLPEPYERLKELTRGRQMDEKLFREVLTNLDIPEAEKQQLSELTPATYLGLAIELSRNPAEVRNASGSSGSGAV